MHSKPPHAAEILATHTPELFRSAVGRAVALLRAGEAVALPTETVYGLAANALDATAVGRIYEIKGRPSHNPIIVHVCDGEMARRCVAAWPEMAEKLSRGFWPGPLTLVLPRSEEIPDSVTAGGATVGVRCPGHPFMLAVIRECGFPLAAPSANLSNRVSPTSAEHVFRHLGDRLRLIVDGGQSNVGIESTVLDLTVQPPRVLRPGMIHEESIAAVIGRGAAVAGVEPGPLKSPGLLPRHYSPRAKLVVWSWQDEGELLRRIQAQGLPAASVHVIAHSRIPSGAGFGAVAVVPHDPEAFARALYSELHRCDDSGAKLIVVEALPDAPAWRAIADRLQRAAGHNS